MLMRSVQEELQRQHAYMTFSAQVTKHALTAIAKITLKANADPIGSVQLDIDAIMAIVGLMLSNVPLVQIAHMD